MSITEKLSIKATQYKAKALRSYLDGNYVMAAANYVVAEKLIAKSREFH